MKLFRLAAFAALFACSDSNGPSDVLKSAEARWAGAGYTSYRFTVQRSCFCAETGRGPVTVTVADNHIVSVVMQGTNVAVDPSIWFTIDDVFDLIHEQLRVLPKRLEAEYDQELGYPASVTYGTPENDAGATISITNVFRS